MMNGILTDKCLKYLEFQKYKLMVCDWNEDTVNKLLMPGMFEDFYYIKYHEGYRDSFDAIPARLFEEIMTTYLPVTVSDLRMAYEYKCHQYYSVILVCIILVMVKTRNKGKNDEKYNS